MNSFHISFHNKSRTTYLTRLQLQRQRGEDWPLWEAAINSELDSLIKRHVFGPVIPAKENTHYTGYKFTFIRKRNAKGEVIRYKARLVAKGYTQVFGRDYDNTYSL